MLLEWHVTPDYIVNNWTEELLELMVGKLAERRNKGATSNIVSADMLAAQSHGAIEVDHGN